jgi:uncharacterized protein YkwD
MAKRGTVVRDQRSGLADPSTRRWVVIGGIGVITSLLLTMAVALLSIRGVASADVALTDSARPNRVTLVREIGGVQRAATPGTGTTASGPANPGETGVADTSGPAGAATSALRQLRKVGRAIVTTDGIRRLALGGALPFWDGTTTTAAAAPDDPRTVARAEADSTTSPDVPLESGSIFLRLHDTGANARSQPGRTAAVVMASPAPTSSSRVTSAEITPTAAPPRPTQVPPTQVPPTQTPFIVTATPVPATPTPVVVTATPDRRATYWGRPAEIVVVTATPGPVQYPSGAVQPQQQTSQGRGIDSAAIVSSIPTVPSAPPAYAAPPTAIPVLPTATPYVAPTQQAASTPPAVVSANAASGAGASSAANAASGPTSAPRRGEPAPAAPAQAGPAPILAEAGTRTPLNPTPRTTPRQQAPAAGQPALPGQETLTGQAPAPGATAAAPAAPSEPSLIEKLTARAVTAVNAARAQAGALPLARNAALDTASTLHAQYDVATGQAEGNFQTRGAPMFLGETPSARVARAAGARGPAVDRIAEVMALGEAEPERAVQGWLNSVFHRVVLLDLAAQYAGFGQHTAGIATTAVMDLGGRRDVANASGWYPANGATEVPTRCACDDYAEATGKPGTFGYPVTLLLGQVRPQGLPTIARLSEGSEDGPGVAAEVVDAYGNPTLLPKAPLKPGTKYVVQMAWTNGPSVTWAFTTAGQ